MEEKDGEMGWGGVGVGRGGEEEGTGLVYKVKIFLKKKNQRLVASDHNKIWIYQCIGTTNKHGVMLKFMKNTVQQLCCHKTRNVVKCLWCRLSQMDIYNLL